VSELSRLLTAIEQGESHAPEELLPLVYDELRKLAARRLAREKPGQTLQATALVHEAYLRLVDVQQAANWNSRGHFFAAAAEAMRRILVERARHKSCQRQGGDLRRCDLSDDDLVALPLSDELIDLDDALVRLGSADEQAAEVAKLRIFAGMTVEEVAEVQGVSPRTVKRNWAYARAWLARELAVYRERDS
jgi:RNA polymerase sigma factor (TIGR02999 family)